MSRKMKFGIVLCVLSLLLTACGSSEPDLKPSVGTIASNTSVSESTTIDSDGTVGTDIGEGDPSSTTLSNGTEPSSGSSVGENQSDISANDTSAQTTNSTATTKSQTAILPTNGSKPISTKKPANNKSTAASTTVATSTTRKTKPVVTVTGPTVTTTTTTAAPTDYPDKHPGGEWQLIWSDEFNGTSLDKNKWNVEVGGNGLIYKKASNVKVEKGKCVLTLLRDTSVSGYQYTGTSITTAHKFSFQYGRLEFRAKLPYGQGVWPALWTMGDYYLTTNDELGWPRCGEIDVMELVGAGGADGKDVYRENKKVTGNLHWGVNRENHQGSYSYHFLADGAAANNYHLYAVEWDEDAIVWYVDNIETHRVTLDDPTMLDSFHQKHWIIMNVALYETANASTPLPQSMYVDYVRVYQKK